MDYLVLGALSASEWGQEGFGAQVDEVAQLRARGAHTAIISEEHWANALPREARDWGDHRVRGTVG